MAKQYHGLGALTVPWSWTSNGFATPVLKHLSFNIVERYIENN